MTETIINLETVNPIEFFGVNNGKLDILKKKFPLLKILSRGKQLKLSGSPEQVENALRILLSDPHVKVVLINIFGGILRCDRVATGIVEAAKRIEMKLPLVVRLEGTNVEDGRRILKESGLKFDVATTFEDAAEKVSRLARP